MIRDERDFCRSISGSTLPSAPASAREMICCDDVKSAAAVIVANKPLATVPTARCVLKFAMLAPALSKARPDRFPSGDARLVQEIRFGLWRTSESDWKNCGWIVIGKHSDFASEGRAA